MLSLYIHIPFCVRKCLYCGFYSTPYAKQDAETFISALRREAAGYQADFGSRVFHTIYIGGGTPTVLTNDQVFRIAAIVKDHFTISEAAEYTIEANPNSAAKKNFSLYLEQGVNRLSFGVQSFSDEILRRLGRLHTAEQAIDAFRAARTAGFRNIGVDLMYGIPGQTRAQWEQTLLAALRLAPEHISAYCLSIDDGSLLKREADAGQFMLPDDERASEMYEDAAATLQSAGYRRYEISNFSLPGFECRHNMNYWDRGEYLGIGPGASSFVAGRRFHVFSDHQKYAGRLERGQSVIEECEILSPDQAAQETLLLRLRTSRGIDLNRFRKEHGRSSHDRLQMNIASLCEAGLLEMADGSAKLTDRGFLLYNEALARLSV